METLEDVEGEVNSPSSETLPALSSPSQGNRSLKTSPWLIKVTSDIPILKRGFVTLLSSLQSRITVRI